MLRVLIKSRFQSLYYSMLKGKKGSSKKSRLGTGILKGIGIGLLAIYIIASVLITLGSVFVLICEPMVKNGFTWLYFSLLAITAFALSFIGSIFTTQTQLYDAKDNELLLSMPIPPSYILASRMIMLLGLIYMFEVMVLIPGIVVYCMVGPVSALGILMVFLTFALLPFLVLTLACIVGFVVALITSRMKNKTIVTLVLSLGFLGAYFYLVNKMSQYMQSIIMYMDDVAKAVKKALYPFYQLGIAIAEGDFVALLLYALCALVPFAIIYILLSKSFIHMATMKRGAARIVYKEKELKVSSPKGALLRKELKHFTSSAMYMMNASLGVLFLVVGAIALLVKQDAVMSELNKVAELKEYLAPIFIMGIVGMSAMNFISAPSISLEGKNLWIAQSIPVKTMDILMAKVDLHLLICLPPVLLASTVSAYVIKADALQIILLFLVPIIYTIFSALFGLVLNLKFPKFNWLNETVAVKQSLSTFLAMFGSMAMLIAPVILYVALLAEMLEVSTYLWIVSVVIALLSLGMYEYIKRRGTKIFNGLTNN